MAKIDVVCKHCGAVEGVMRNGKSKSGAQRYYCRQCLGTFQLSYSYNGRQEGIAERIVEMAMNGSGVRDTARVLGISNTTVIKHLKDSRRPK